jgi:hypothetical protein
VNDHSVREEYRQVEGFDTPRRARTAALEEITFEHQAPRPGFPYDHHTLIAHHPDSAHANEYGENYVGHLEWDPLSKTIVSVGTHHAWRRRGVATELHRHAKEIQPDLQHDNSWITRDGRAGARTMAAHVPEDEPQVRVFTDIPWTTDEWAEARREPWRMAATLAQEEVRRNHPALTRRFPAGDEGDEMVGHILRHVGYDGDTAGAFVARHPNPELMVSHPSWLGVRPGVALHPGKWDYGTVTHECAHHAVMYANAEARNEYRPDEQVHGPQWARAYARGLNWLAPHAGDDFLFHHQRFYDMIGEGLQWQRPSDLDAADEDYRRMLREGSQAAAAGDVQKTGYHPDELLPRWNPDSSNYGWCHDCQLHHEHARTAEEHEAAAPAQPHNTVPWDYAGEHLPSGEIGYHGTWRKLSPGDHVEPGHESNYGEDYRDLYVYFTTHEGTGSAWAHDVIVARAECLGEDVSDLRPHVYVVEPTGPFRLDEANLDNYDREYQDFKSEYSLRVVREIPYDYEPGLGGLHFEPAPVDGERCWRADDDCSQADQAAPAEGRDQGRPLEEPATARPFGPLSPPPRHSAGQGGAGGRPRRRPQATPPGRTPRLR